MRDGRSHFFPHSRSLRPRRVSFYFFFLALSVLTVIGCELRESVLIGNRSEFKSEFKVPFLDARPKLLSENKYQMELEIINDLDKRIDRLTEFSVIEQVRNLAKTTIVQEAWKKRPVVLHGWVYGINSGIITELNVVDKNNKDLEPIYRFDI